MRIDRRAVAVLLGAAAAPAAACGFCIEDRVAAVYEQALVDGALARHRNVAFFALEGTLTTDAATRRAVLAALDSRGGERGSARLSLENKACSIAYDPGHTNLVRLAAAAERALASRGVALIPLRVIDAGGRLRDP